MVDYGISEGTVGLRNEVIDSMVKQIAAQTYKFKQACAIVPTSAWKNTFFRENTDVLAGGVGNTTKGLPRGANFPQATVSWEEVSVRIVKYGLEDNIAWEDLLANDINIQSRTVIKLTAGVVKAVDDEIWDGLTETLGTASSNRIQSFAIDGTTQGSWDEASAAIIDNIMRASEMIGKKNYDTSDLMCFVSPRDKRSIMKYLADKGAQWMPVATDIVTNGNIGRIAGVTIIESNSVTASYALVVKPKTCATWKELVSLRSTTVDDPYKSLKIRVVEEGVLELTDPLAVVLIKNTQSPNA